MDATFVPIPCSPSPPAASPDFLMDDIINTVGFGRWTYLYFLISALVPMALVGNLFVSEFSTPNLNFTCDNRERESSTTGRSVEWLDTNNFEDYSTYDKPMLSEEDLLIERRHLQLLQAMGYDYINQGATVQENHTTESPFNASVSKPSDSVPQYRNDVTNVNHEDERCLVGPPATADKGNQEVKFCKNFDFDSSIFGWTLTEEFSLVCDLAWLRALYQMVFTMGCIVGAATGGMLSDKYGRRKTVFWGSVLATSASLLAAAAPSFGAELACRLLLGAFAFIAVNPLTTLALEVCPLTHRHTYGPIESLPYAAMLPLLALAAHLCQHWRPLQLWLTAPLLLAVLVASGYIMDESPRWLVLKGRVAEAERAIKRAAKLHGTSHLLSSTLHQQLEMVHKRHLKTQSQWSTTVWEHVRSLVSTSEMRTISVVTAAMWFLEGALYISLPLQATEYRSPFLYLALIGVLEVPGALLVAPLGECLGRRTACSVLSCVCAGAMFCLAYLRQTESAGENALMMVSVVAYTALVGVSQMVTILTSELYPTSVRSLGSSMGYLANNIGNCVPPILDILFETQGNNTPLLVYAFLALVNSCLALHLPETNLRRLYETVDEFVDEERSLKCDPKLV